MVLDLSGVSFENDFFKVDLPTGNILVINSLDESTDTGTDSTVIRRINLQLNYLDEDSQELFLAEISPVIGLDNEYLKIETDYTELEGCVLTQENFKQCRINVYE